ncbi:xanthine dehydrogenase accessory protein XdhC [Pararhodobacter zhoushanensis]|uniref:Xanthine dehydrogenase accessory protein XdhC n=1 Tax=Pararhodobacter zhoushanensis TaxID=2479545 RepID=A0ABT3H0Q9_9RHOB|nr:xanthine dehydrogenase accessory protein XdhC [Pararhodobacter zhoushanensis]MCW1933401.1 xanthine dehydrogenase accessory protein XdhC [Pararhodobacter zhoushanensis]
MFDRAGLAQAVASHGAVTRVVICGHQGSSPREAGAAMLVWADGQSGTIGGGALEFDATTKARAMLAGGAARVEKTALGPALGQCCGGAVTLGFERFDASVLREVPETGLFARPVARDAAAEPPLAILRALKATRNQGTDTPALRYLNGWLAEPVSPPARDLWIWGAGHVGRALVNTLHPLPGLRLTWIDTDSGRFPDTIPAGVTALTAANPATLTPQAPPDAEHLILTFSHALDLDLCHRLLTHGFAACGLIGSASKWARFRSRLQALGHAPVQIDRIRCPIGDPSFGKHPQAIAISVAAEMLARPLALAPAREIAR